MGTFGPSAVPFRLLLLCFNKHSRNLGSNNNSNSGSNNNSHKGSNHCSLSYSNKGSSHSISSAAMAKKAAENKIALPGLSPSRWV